ncbi:MAG: hypothetical protein ACLP8Y_03720 [Thermoplasmata archaeon]
MRDTGSGYINLAWSGGLVKAFMVWSIMDDSVPAQTATINGHDVTGTWVAFASPSPCWSPTYIYEMVADVTAYVTNGNNTLTNFPSGITTGADPWASAQIDPMLEGASLVVVNQSAGPGIHQVTLYTGAQTIYTAFGSITAPLNYTAATSTGATTTYVVSDGQLPGNSAGWNGATIDSNAFPGSDPKDTPFTWSYGNLYDTKTYSVNVGLGSISTPASIAGETDCLTWDAQVLSVAVAPSEGPYTASFSEAGLPEGTTWGVTVGATHLSGVVGPTGSTLTFTLSDGTYSYTVSPVAGYVTVDGSGTFAIAGGKYYQTSPFHAGQGNVATLDSIEPNWNSGNLCDSISYTGPGDVTCVSLVSEAPFPLWYNFSAGTIQGGTVTVVVYGSADCINLNFHSFYSTIVIDLLGSDYSCPATPASAGGPGVNVVVNSEGDSFTYDQYGSQYVSNITFYGTTTYASDLMDGSVLNTTVTYIGWSPATNACPSGITDGRVAWSEVSFGSFNTFNTIFVDGTNVAHPPVNYAYSTESLQPPDGNGYGTSDLYGNETTQTEPLGACSYLGT